MSLATLDEIKSYYDMTGSDAAVDDELAEISVRISKIFETYCDRSFESTTYTEYHDGDNRNGIYLNHYPITSITSIYDDSEWGWGSDYVVASGTYRIKDERAVTLKAGYTFHNHTQNVKVTYVAGYSTIPADLNHVCIVEVIRSYKSRKEVDVTAKTLGDGSISYTSRDFLPMTKVVLDKYTRKGIM